MTNSACSATFPQASTRTCTPFSSDSLAKTVLADMTFAQEQCVGASHAVVVKRLDDGNPGVLTSVVGRARQAREQVMHVDDVGTKFMDGISNLVLAFDRVDRRNGRL